jgi:hypothetical protein
VQIYNSCVIWVVATVFGAASRMGFLELSSFQSIVLVIVLSLYGAMSTVIIIIFPKALFTLTEKNLTKEAALKEMVWAVL